MNRYRIPGWLVKFIWLVVLSLLAFDYFALNSYREPIHSFETAVDEWIPLVPAFVFAYLSLHALLALSIWRLLKSETRIFSIAALAISLDLMLSYLVFLFYQTQVERPIIGGGDVSSDILKAVYSFDQPFNAFPSLHTSLSVLAILLWRKVGPRIQPIIAVWALFIIASTVLTKQHYIADVGGGIAVSLVSYYVAVKFSSFAAGKTRGN
jgi:membrane-associated phospholipid phosphatase